MKINKLPKDTTAKNDGEIIYSEDGQHLTRISRQDFLKGYGGGGKGGDGGLQYFQETEHALTGKVIWNGLSDNTLDGTQYGIPYQNGWLARDPVWDPNPYDTYEWGRVNGIVTGTGYTFGNLYGQAFGWGYTGNYQEGYAPTVSAYRAACVGDTDVLSSPTSFSYIFKKTNPGVTYMAMIRRPPRWADYPEGQSHSTPSSKNTDWKLITVLLCETERPTFELYRVRKAKTREVPIDKPKPPEYTSGDGVIPEEVMEQIIELIGDEDSDISELITDDLATHSSGNYAYGEVWPVPPFDGQYIQYDKNEMDPWTANQPRSDADVGNMENPATWFDLSDSTKFELIAESATETAAVISDMGWAEESALIGGIYTYKGHNYYISFCRNGIPNPYVSGHDWNYRNFGWTTKTGSRASSDLNSRNWNNFGNSACFAIPGPYLLPYRGGRYKPDGGYQPICYGETPPNQYSHPESAEQYYFGAGKIIYALCEALIPTNYYSGLKRNDQTVFFVGADDADGNNPIATIDIMGNSTLNGGGSGSGGATGEVISDVFVDGVSVKAEGKAYITSGSGELQRYLLQERRTTWDSTNLRWNTELVALPDVGDNSGDKYIPVPDTEVLYLGNWGGGFYNSGTGELLLGQYQWRGINGQGQSYNSNDDIKVKLGNRLLFDNTTRVLSVDDTGIIDGAEDIPVDDYWIKAIPQQGGGYALSFRAQFDSSYFDVQRSSSTPYYPYITLKNAARPKTYTAGTGIDVNGLVISVNDDNGDITNMPTFVQNHTTNKGISPKGNPDTSYSSIHDICAIYPSGAYSMVGVWHIEAIVKIPTNQYTPTNDNECIDIWISKNPSGIAEYDDDTTVSMFEKPRTRIMVRDYSDDDYIYAKVEGVMANDTANVPIWVCASHNTDIGATTPGTSATITGVEVVMRAYKLNTNGSGYIITPPSST